MFRIEQPTDVPADDDLLRAWADDAGSHGDLAGRAICLVALGEDPASLDPDLLNALAEDGRADLTRFDARNIWRFMVADSNPSREELPVVLWSLVNYRPIDAPELKEAGWASVLADVQRTIPGASPSIIGTVGIQANLDESESPESWGTWSHAAWDLSVGVLLETTPSERKTILRLVDAEPACRAFNGG